MRKWSVLVFVVACGAIVAVAQSKEGQQSRSGHGVKVGGLVWQDPPASRPMTWREARMYCATLHLDGHGGWRLPTISELRSLVRGCPSTVLKGECSVSSRCGDYKRCWSERCQGCNPMQGPGIDGLYLVRGLHPGPLYTFWSGTQAYTVVKGGFVTTGAWLIGFDYANIGDVPFDNLASVRCVYSP